MKKDKKIQPQTEEKVKVADAEKIEDESKEAPAGDGGKAEAKDISLEDLLKKMAQLKSDAEEQTKLAAKEKERADDMTKAAQTLRADFDNYRRRVREESVKDREKGQIDVIESVIPVLDAVDQAIGMIADDNVKKGVEMIRAQLIGLLTKYNVEEIEAKGLDFDPKYHEAIMQTEGDGTNAGKVSDVFQKGYKLGDRIIRPARVIVFK